jgi:hypothetical protein
MSKSIKWIFFLLIFFLLQTPLSFCSSGYTLMESCLNQSRTKKNFVSPSREELQTAQQLFYKLFKGEREKNLIQSWKELNFSMKEMVWENKLYTLIMEDDESRTGRGLYVFPKTPQKNSVLMIPHGLHDYYTDKIGIQLTLEGQFSATAFNTVHRYGNRSQKALPDERTSQQEVSTAADETWDMTQLPDTYFTAFTTAFATAFPKGTLIQLHGFSKNNRKTPKGKNSDFIISSGTRKITAQVKQFINCLKMETPNRICVYPDDVLELGGTRNITGSVLRSLGHQGFLHIEMELSIRKKLKDDPMMRESFLKCIEVL